MPTAWRIVKRQHIAEAFNGEGARAEGGRWNSRGVAVVYAAQSRALAALEMLVHLRQWSLLEAAYALCNVSFDDALVQEAAAARLPQDWRSAAGSVRLQQWGDAWVAEARSAVLRVPSAIIPQEFNYVLNPGHADFRKVKIGTPESFMFDERLRQ